MKVDRDYMKMMRSGKQLDRQLIEEQQINGFMVSFCILATIAIILLGLTVNAHAYTEDEVVRCIIGEAANQDVIGMVAVGEAIRNRGHLRGVYGCQAKFVDSEPEWVWVKARMAWEKSATSNLVKGADHWYANWISEPYWASSMTKTVKIGQHIFYKE